MFDGQNVSAPPGPQRWGAPGGNQRLPEVASPARRERVISGVSALLRRDLQAAGGSPGASTVVTVVTTCGDVIGATCAANWARNWSFCNCKLSTCLRNSANCNRNSAISCFVATSFIFKSTSCLAHKSSANFDTANFAAASIAPASNAAIRTICGSSSKRAASATVFAASASVA
jgi:hypothetical protein